MTERPDPAKVIPGPDPGACPSCGEWRKSGMIHNCGSNPVNYPVKVIAEALRGWLPVSLADRARAQELAEAVLAALAAAGFPVGDDALREAERAGYCRGRDNERAVREAAQLDPDTDDFTVTCDELDRALDRAEKAEADAKRLFTALDGYIMARITGTDLRDYDDLAERAARAHRALAAKGER